MALMADGSGGASADVCRDDSDRVVEAGLSGVFLHGAGCNASVLCGMEAGM